MKQYPLLLVLVCIISHAFSQGVLFHSPADQAIGRTGALGQTSWSFFSNPSGIAGVQHPSASFGYHAGFHIKELGSRAILITMPTSLLTGAAGLVHFGFEHFNIQQYSLAAGRQMAPWLRMGIRFNYLRREQVGSARFGIFTLDAGLQINPDPKVTLGFHVVNPARVKWHLVDWEEYQPTLTAVAMAYKPVEGLNIELGVVKNGGYPAEISFGIEAPVHTLVVLRGAVITKPVRLGFGAGLLWQYIGFDAGFSHHDMLGLSSTFGLVFYPQLLSPNNEW